MHILLTDLLHCPRCGVGHGLVLLADRIVERRVLGGLLGCSNCREQYPITDGALDLRTGAGMAEGEPFTRDEGAAWLAALMGLAGASGTVAVAGGGAKLAPALAGLVPDVEVVALKGVPAPGPEGMRVSRVAADGFPFRAGSLRAVALTGGVGVDWRDALRAVAPRGRLLVDGAQPGLGEALRAEGVDVLLEQEGVLVATAPGP